MLEQFQELLEKQGQRDAANPHYQRLSASYGRRCEEWAKRDYWTMDEAANLLAGTDPGRPQRIDGQNELNQLTATIRNFLKRANISKEGGLTKRVLAKEVMKWAVGKDIEVPEPLLLATGLKAKKGEKVHGNTIKNAEKREKVLGAAMVALIRYPSQCKDRGDKFTGKQIATILEQYQGNLFSEGVAPYCIRTMGDIINKYLPEK